MARPPVDIIVPFRGQYESVTRCISSILSCTPNQDYKLILVDDGSANEHYLPKIIKNKQKIKGVQLKPSGGFGAALQAGFLESKAPYVVFMHSDVWVEDVYWLLNLQRSLATSKYSGVKLVTSRTNNPGTSASYDERMFGQKGDLAEDVVSTSPTPLICAICHRELFSRIGGFIKNYPFAWYEDEELFWRMKYYGFKQGIAHNSWVNHAGGLTIKEALRTEPRVKKLMENNRNLCLDDLRLYLPKNL